MLLQPVSRESSGRGGRRTAFTLLEVLIVVAIIVILAGVGGVYVLRAYDDAKESIAQTSAHSLGKAAQDFYVRYDRYPESLNELLTPPGGGKPYIEPELLNDPWDHQFQYDPSGPNNNGLKPDVFTTSPNGERLGNWKRGTK